jgi:hypothetical protein
MAKDHRKPNSERVVDTDVLADHRESCVEKAQASGEPCALKGASTVCAVRRVVVSLLQAGGTEEKFLGYWHI